MTCLPYLAAWRLAPAGSSFDWIIPPYPEDGLAYLAWVKQAALGAWLFKIKYTALPQQALIFNPFFLAAGWLSRLTGLGAGAALFAARVPGVVLFLLALERLLKQLPLTGAQRTLAIALASLSSGFGGLVARGWLSPGLNPTDLWLPDSNTLWALTWNPLFPYALALMLSAIALAQSAARPRDFAWPGALTALLASIHPYDAVVVGCVIAGLAVGSRWTRSLLYFALAAAPGVLYPAWLSLRDPALSAHAARGILPSPGLAYHLWGFGLPGVLALAGAWLAVKRGQAKALRCVLLWAGASLLLSYAPVWFQRKLLFGVHVPVCILAALGADASLAWLSGGKKRLYAGLAALLVAASAETHLHNFNELRRRLIDPQTLGYYYVDHDLQSALEYLAAHSSPDAVVLAGLRSSQFIPGFSGNTVVYGHWAQSIDLDQRRAWVLAVLSPASGLAPRKRLDALREAGVRFLLVDAETRTLLGGSIPAWLSQGAEAVERSGGVELWRLG